MTWRACAASLGVLMIAFGGILVVPVVGPLLASPLGFVFLGAGLVQLVASLAGSNEVTCPHCQKKSNVRVGFWTAKLRLSNRDD